MVVNSQDKNCPILLENVTFGILSEYLVSKTNQTEGAADVRTTKLLSKLRYERSRSVVLFLYKEVFITVDGGIQSKLCCFISGLKIIVDNKKGFSLVEGKIKMSFKVYEKLCELFIESEGSKFVYCFLVLGWNLMSQS